ncbi:kinesin light chain [Hypoxylon sp. FL0890]|nr:kinesin light chain [Hypoxylon sp. FL0890]
MAGASKRLKREDYHVAWICPVADLELLPSRLMLDEEHDTPHYDTTYDDNVYTCGSVTGHNVVLATCPPGLTGNVNAGRLAGPMFKTFPNIRMALLVGIGGGVPRSNTPEDSTEDVHLGDVVVGWPGDGKPACVYYDSGKWHTDGKFETTSMIDKPDRVLLNALGKLESDHEVGRTTFHEHLEKLRAPKHRRKFVFPGLDQDRLFQADYHHYGPNTDRCANCDTSKLVIRTARTEEDVANFVFHRGRIATGNAVVRDGIRREEISKQCDGVLCIEMEAAGVDASGRCLVIRGISDYADSHKNDLWRSYAAGNAAVFARELLGKIPASTVTGMESFGAKAPFVVPFGRNLRFTGRLDHLKRLKARLARNECQKLAVCGLGGCGKTALVVEFAHWVRDNQPQCAVFWVPALSRKTYDQAYREIGTALRIPQILNNQVDNEVGVRRLVNEKLSSEEFGPWLMIIDNADDVKVLFDRGSTEEKRLIDDLPRSSKGSIVFTTRTRKAAVDLASSSWIWLDQLDIREARDFLDKRIPNKDLISNDAVVQEFLEQLTYLPLAIVQAVAFITKNNVGLAQYTQLFKGARETGIELLRENFQDDSRYENANNAVATTWHISFDQICREDALAADYLAFMACVRRNNIPASLLPPSSPVAMAKALGTLKAYAFVTVRLRQRAQKTLDAEAYDVHRLVHTATQEWLKIRHRWRHWVDQALRRLVDLLPKGPTYETKHIWEGYLMHGTCVADLSGDHEANTTARVLLLHRIGYCQDQLGQYIAAEETFRRTLALARKVLGEEHPETLSTMRSLGRAILSQGNYISAEKILSETVAICNKALGKEHHETLSSTISLCISLMRQGKYFEAEKILLENLELTRKVYGREHINTLTAMSNLGWLYGVQGKKVKAEETLREVYEFNLKALGEKHPRTLLAMKEIGMTLLRLGNYSEAEELLRKTLPPMGELFGKEHPRTLFALNVLGLALVCQKGKEEEAEKILRDTFKLMSKVLGEEHPDTLSNLENIGVALHRQGRYTEGEQIFRQVLKSGKERLNYDDLLSLMRNLHKSLNAQGKHAEAEDIHRQIMSLSEDVSAKSNV